MSTENNEIPTKKKVDFIMFFSQCIKICFSFKKYQNHTPFICERDKERWWQNFFDVISLGRSARTHIHNKYQPKQWKGKTFVSTIFQKSTFQVDDSFFAFSFSRSRKGLQNGLIASNCVCVCERARPLRS